MRAKLRNDSRGFTLVTTMVGAALVGIVAVTSATLIGNFASQMQQMTQKMEIMEVENSMRASFVDASICGCNLKGLTFNATAANSVLSLPAVYGGCDGAQGILPIVEKDKALAGSTTGLKVANVEMKNFAATSDPGRYRADLIAQLDQKSLRMARHPPKIEVHIHADVSSPSQAKIEACSSSGTGLPVAENKNGANQGSGSESDDGDDSKSGSGSGAGSGSGSGPRPALLNVPKCQTRGYSRNSFSSASGGCKSGGGTYQCQCAQGEGLLSCSTWTSDSGSSYANFAGGTANNGVCKTAISSFTTAYLVCCTIAEE